MKKILYELIVNNSISILHNNIDWYSLLSQSISEKVEGFLFKILCENNFLDNIPKPVCKILYISYQYNQSKNSFYIQEFNNVQKLLYDNEISVYPYKGIFLVKNIYKDSGIRYMEDMDLVLKETDYLLLEKIMRKLNYQLVLINDAKILQYESGKPISSCLFIKRNSPKDLIPFVKLDFTFLLETPQKYEIFVQNQELSPQYNFVLLCENFFNDACEKYETPLPENCTLMKFIDIQHFIKNYPRETEYILFNSNYSDTKYIAYVRKCLNYFSKGEYLWI